MSPCSLPTTINHSPYSGFFPAIHLQTPPILDSDPQPNIFTAEFRVRRQPVGWVFRTLGSVRRSGYGDQSFRVGQVVGVLDTLCRCPGSTSAPMHLSQRNKMINVQPARVGEMATSEGIKPATGHYLTAPCIQGDLNQTLRNQYLLPCALAVAVRIDPTPVKLPVVGNTPRTTSR